MHRRLTKRLYRYILFFSILTIINCQPTTKYLCSEYSFSNWRIDKFLCENFGLKTITNYSQAIAIAKENNKPILIFFTSSANSGIRESIEKHAFREFADFQSHVS